MDCIYIVPLSKALYNLSTSFKHQQLPNKVPIAGAIES